MLNSFLLGVVLHRHSESRSTFMIRFQKCIRFYLIIRSAGRSMRSMRAKRVNAIELAIVRRASTRTMTTVRPRNCVVKYPCARKSRANLAKTIDILFSMLRRERVLYDSRVVSLLRCRNHQIIVLIAAASVGCVRRDRVHSHMLCVAFALLADASLKKHINMT